MKLYHLLLLSLVTFTGCKKSLNLPPVSQGGTDSVKATLEIPQKINIYPAITNNGNGPGRIYLFTKDVGNVSVRIPMIFDTGSAGVVLNALSIFPDTLVDQNGFKFKPGQETIIYNGITVKKIVAEKVYGASTNTVTRKIGNLGYAKMSVGDASGSVQALTMPILFYFQTQVNGIISQTATGSVFGVNANYNNVVGAQDSSFKISLVSPLKYLIFKGITAGYTIDPVELHGCEIIASGNCQPQQALTIGITQRYASSYQMTNLAISNQQAQSDLPTDFPAYPKYPLYNAYISGASVGNSYRKRLANILLDTGTPGVNLNVSSDSIQAEKFPLIILTLPSGGTYTYNYKTSNFPTAFNRNNTSSVYGVYFFTAFGFLEDYRNGLRGVKAK